MNDTATHRHRSEADVANGVFLKRRLKRLLLIALAIILLPYLFYRTTSDSRKLVRCDYPDANLTAQNLDPSNRSPQSVRIATWNIAHGRGSTDDNWAEGGEEKLKRIDKIATAIIEFEADVVVLNEVDFSATWSGGMDQAELIANKAGYPFCIKQANLDFGFIYGRWYFGNAILSRLPVSEERIVELKPLAEWESWLVGHKRGLSCTIEASPNHKLSVVGLHLESRGEAIRVKQIDDIARHCGQLKEPLIVAGDLNTTPSDFPNGQSNANGINAFDKLIKQTEFHFHPKAVTNSNSLTYSSNDPKLLIDWVLFSHQLRLVDQKIIDSQLSDHRPVVSTLEFDLHPDGNPVSD